MSYKFSQELRDNLIAVLGSNFILKDQELTITLANQYQLIENGMKKLLSKNTTFELAKFSPNKAKTALYETVSAILSG